MTGKGKIYVWNVTFSLSSFTTICREVNVSTASQEVRTGSFCSITVINDESCIEYK